MSSHPITAVGAYVTVFLSLAALTVITVAVAYFDFGWLNTPVALGIAGVKAWLVVWFFMGVRYNTPLTKLTAVAGLFWLLIMFGLTMADYLTRTWMAVPGR